jgi:hypothetical protein
MLTTLMGSLPLKDHGLACPARPSGLRHAVACHREDAEVVRDPDTKSANNQRIEQAEWQLACCAEPL